jgi:hypothetical protein
MTDELSFSWPEEGDRLFTSDPDLWHNAHIVDAGDDWHQFIVGYKHAADVLIAKALDDWSDRNYLVLPAIFLYRQYLELQLKQLIRDGKALLNLEPIFPKTHHLGKLWAECRKVVEEIYPSDSSSPTKDLLAVEECIIQFASIDPTSTAFRYPEDKDGRTLLPDDSRIIDLRNLLHVMDKIGNFLDGAATGISVYLDDKKEMESYYSDYETGW